MVLDGASQWSLTFEVRKSRTYGPGSPSQDRSQWSLTFEVRKSWKPWVKAFADIDGRNGA